VLLQPLLAQIDRLLQPLLWVFQERTVRPHRQLELELRSWGRWVLRQLPHCVACGCCCCCQWWCCCRLRHCVLLLLLVQRQTGQQ
jgi:hypothetical protein